MGKNKGSNGRGAGSNPNTLRSKSAALPGVLLSNSAPDVWPSNTSVEDDVLDCIDALNEKSATRSTREAAWAALVDAFEKSVLLDHMGNNYMRLLSQFNNSVKKGSIKEACLASRAIGLLAITLGAGRSSHEMMTHSHVQLSRILQTWSDEPKMISALNCLAVVSFVGETDVAGTELSLQAIWDVIHPKSGSDVKPPVLAAAVSAWTFLLTTIRSWKIKTNAWKKPIAHLATLLEAKDRAVRMAAGEALALCFELQLFDLSSSEVAEIDTRETGSTKPPFSNARGSEGKRILGLVHNLSIEAGGKGADKKNLNEQKELFRRIIDFFQHDACPEESIRIFGGHGILKVSSWSQVIQLNFLRRYLGTGFLKHAQTNGFLRGLFEVKPEKTAKMSSSDKKAIWANQDKNRAKLMKMDRQWSLMMRLSP